MPVYFIHSSMLRNILVNPMNYINVFDRKKVGCQILASFGFSCTSHSMCFDCDSIWLISNALAICVLCTRNRFEFNVPCVLKCSIYKRNSTWYELSRIQFDSNNVLQFEMHFALCMVSKVFSSIFNIFIVLKFTSVFNTHLNINLKLWPRWEIKHT